jgi:ABC-type phosphate/phosphonate transport system substrate-binding protein
MSLGHPHVELGMYPFASVAWAWDELWAAVHRRAPWTPSELTRSGDVHARWYDPECVVTHVCGWPFISLHHTDMQLIGAMSLDLVEAEGVGPGHYRSVIVSRHDATIDELLASGPHAVANSADSLSGWLSLLAATVGPGNPWPSAVTFTSAHLDSVRAVSKGEADLASIDAWSLALVEAEEPGLLDGIHRIGLGPRIPTPAITIRRTVDPAAADELRDAFEDALASDGTTAARSALRITGFAALTLDDYLATLPLAPAR